MAENKEKIELEGDSSKLDATLRKSDKNVRTFGSSVKNVFAGIKGAIDAANETFGTFGKIATAFSSGLILKKLFSLEEFEKVDDALLMMQANLKMTAKELDGFKSKMTGMAGKNGEDMGALAKASSKLSKAYNTDDILKILDASSMASHAMEQDLIPVQERIVQIMKMYNMVPDEAKNIAESLAASNADPEILNVLLQRGVLKGGGSKDYKEVLAMASALQKMGIVSPKVVMGVESIMFAILEKQKILKRDLGVDIFKIDPTTGKKVAKSYDEILSEMKPAMEKMRKKLGDETFNKKTDEIFGPAAHEAFPVLFSHIKVITKAYAEQGNSAQIAAQRATKAEEKWSEQLNKIKGNLAAIKTDLSWIYDLGKKPVKFLADSPHLTKGLGYGAAGLSIAVLGGMAYGKGRQFLKNMNLGKTAVGIAEGKAVEAATGVTPVFVTNWPANINGGGLPNPNIPKVPGFGTKIGTAATTVAGALATPAGLGATLAVEALAAAAYWKASSDEAAGLRKWRTDNPYDYARSKEVMGINPVNHNDINLTVHIDKDRIVTRADDLNTKLNVNRGEHKY